MFKTCFFYITLLFCFFDRRFLRTSIIHWKCNIHILNIVFSFDYIDAFLKSFKFCSFVEFNSKYKLICCFFKNLWKCHHVIVNLLLILWYIQQQLRRMFLYNVFKFLFVQSFSVAFKSLFNFCYVFKSKIVSMNKWLNKISNSWIISQNINLSTISAVANNKSMIILKFW